MVGKWYKYIGKKDKYFTPNKWYLCQELDSDGNLQFIDNDNDVDELNWFYLEKLNENIDLSNPRDYNPDEVKEETKPQFKVESITIVILQDGSYQTTSTLEYPKMIKHIKEVAYLGDKQINENT